MVDIAALEVDVVSRNNDFGKLSTLLGLSAIPLAALITLKLT